MESRSALLHGAAVVGFSDTSTADVWKRRHDDADVRARRTGSPTRDAPMSIGRPGSSRAGAASVPLMHSFSRPNSAKARGDTTSTYGSYSRTGGALGLAPMAPTSPAPSRTGRPRSHVEMRGSFEYATDGTPGMSPVGPSPDLDDSVTDTHTLASTGPVDDVAALYVGMVDAGSTGWGHLLGDTYTNHPELMMLPKGVAFPIGASSLDSSSHLRQNDRLPQFFPTVSSFLKSARSFDELNDPHLILEASWAPIKASPHRFLRAVTGALSVSDEDAMKVYVVVDRIMEGFRSRVLAWDLDESAGAAGRSITKYRDEVIDAVVEGGAYYEDHEGAGGGQDVVASMPTWTPKATAVWCCALSHFVPPFEM